MESNLQAMNEFIEAFRQIKKICEVIIEKYQLTVNEANQHSESTQFSSVKPQKNSAKININLGNEKNTNKKSLSQKINNKLIGKPKSPLTPYFLFFQSKRQFIHKKYPYMSQSQMANVAGQVWRSLSAEQKRPYQEQYLRNKIQHKKKMQNFYNMNPDQMPKKLKKAKQEGDQDQSQGTQNIQFLSFSQEKIKDEYEQ